MSIKVMSQVWEHSQMKGSALLLLIAVADFADDEGYAFPSTETLAQKIRMSTRQVIRLRQMLYESGELEYVSGGNGKGDKLSVKVSVRVTNRVTKGDKSGKERVTNRVTKGDTRVTRTVIEPPIEPSGGTACAREGTERQPQATPPPADLPAEETEPQQADNRQQSNQLPQRTHPNAEKISAYMNGQPPPPRQNWRQQQTGEHLAAAAKHGVNAKQFHALTNALLDATSNRALADADGPEADRALSKAKEAAVTAASLGIKTPEDVQARAKAFAENHPAEWVPHYGQLLKQRPPDEKPQAQFIAVPAQPPLWAG